MKITTSPRQGRHREVGSEGSWRPRCAVRNTNGITGSRPWDEVAQHTEQAGQGEITGSTKTGLSKMTPSRRLAIDSALSEDLMDLTLLSDLNRPGRTRMPGWCGD